MPPFPWPWPYLYSPGARYEIEPSGIYAGAALRFIKFFQIYPANCWTLYYGLVPIAGGTSGAIRFESVPLNGGNWHLINVPPEVTKTWAKGQYAWQVFVQNDDDATCRYYVSKGTIEVFADLTSVATDDSRGPYTRVHDSIMAMIQATAENPMAEIAIGRGTIAGQSTKGWDMEKLTKMERQYAWLAANERRINAMKGGAPNNRIKRGAVRPATPLLGYGNVFPPFGT